MSGKKTTESLVYSLDNEKIKKIIKEKGFKDSADFSNISGVEGSHIWRILNGSNKNPSISVCVMICDALGIVDIREIIKINNKERYNKIKQNVLEKEKELTESLKKILDNRITLNNINE